jgi:hypothetical protein
LNRVGRLEGSAQRSPSGKRDLVSHFVVVVMVVRGEPERAREHLVITGICHFNINREVFPALLCVE